MRREKVPPRLRSALIQQARGGCFAHRLTWLPRQIEDTSLFIPLDVHHVVFVSAGGDNSRDNLVPICPLCHRVVHESGKLGASDATPDRIREEWKRWLSFATLADAAPIGDSGQSFEAFVRLNIYHVTIPFVIGRHLSYATARQGMIAHVLERLSKLDDDCPFGARVLFPEFWECTADRIAPKPWEQVAAHVVIDQVSQPMNLRAPIPIFAAAGRASLSLEILERQDRTL